MMVTWVALNVRHTNTTQCAKGEQRKRRRLATEEMREIMERAFQAYRIPLNLVTLFNNLDWIMMALDDDWPEMVGRLRKSRESWARLLRILGREGANPMVLGIFFKAVVQAVLLFGSETWVTTPCMGWNLGDINFHPDASEYAFL